VLPFDGPTIHALTIRVLTGEPTPIEQLRPDLASAFVHAVRLVLVRDREGRFPTAKALAEALAPVRRPSLMPPSLTPPALDVAAGPTVASVHPSPWSTSAQSSASTPRLWRPWVLATVTIAAGAVAAAFALLRASASSTAMPQNIVESAPASVSRAGPFSAAEGGFGPAGTMTTVESAPVPLPSHDPGAVHAPRIPATNRVPLATTAAAAPASASPAASSVSGAQSLGLREDNPFR
jgi:serine/threonine-protein kinase